MNKTKKIIFTISLFLLLIFILLIVLNKIPYAYDEITGRSISCSSKCPDKYSERSGEVYRYDATHNGRYFETICTCYTSVLKKSVDWLFDLGKYSSREID